jgi:phosphatidylglycerophosphatase A
MNALTSIICTVFYTGLIPFAPGTFGTIAGVFFAYLLNFDVFILFIIGTILFVVGYIFSDIYAQKKADKDPKEVVIDEVVGIFVALIICFGFVNFVAYYERKTVGYFISHYPLYSDLIIAFVAFVLFRFFDIVKPSIIGVIDRKTEGGMGIMLDDVLAGLFAGIIFVVISPFFLLLYKILYLS